MYGRILEISQPSTKSVLSFLHNLSGTCFVTSLLFLELVYFCLLNNPPSCNTCMLLSWFWRLFFIFFNAHLHNFWNDTLQSLLFLHNSWNLERFSSFWLESSCALLLTWFSRLLGLDWNLVLHNSSFKFSDLVIKNIV